MEEQRFLDAPEAGEKEYEYAGFWIRFVAALIDGIIMSLVSLISIAIFGVDSIATNVVGLIAGITYHVYFLTSPKQATIGKQLLNIYVVDTNYQKIDTSKAIIRYFSQILSALILLIGYIMAAFDDRKQSLHDKIAGTYVIYGKPE